MAGIGQTPKYSVQLRQSCRPAQGQQEPMVGIAWEVIRLIGQREGEWQDSETLFASPDVFDDEDDAKRNAVETLGSLLCCEDSPLRTAFRTAIDWIVEEN